MIRPSRKRKELAIRLCTLRPVAEKVYTASQRPRPAPSPRRGYPGRDCMSLPASQSMCHMAGTSLPAQGEDRIVELGLGMVAGRLKAAGSRAFRAS